MSGKRPFRLASPEELSDTTLPERSRSALISLVRYVESRSTYQELFYLATAFEDAAVRMRQDETVPAPRNDAS